MKKIENIIKDGNYLEAVELISKELNKKFNFNNKKSRTKFIELHKQKSRLSSRLKNLKKSKSIKGKGQLGLISDANPIIKYLTSLYSSTPTGVPKRISESEILRKRLYELTQIANTKNPYYLEILKVVAYSIDETNRLMLILGETGVGKSYLAEKIHYLSNRKSKPFKVVDCSKLTENLLESELFGHIRGAYTGAISNRDGALKTAEGGTLFIDEVHRASAQIRDRLLNFLIDKKYKPTGSDKNMTSDVRIIMGTNQDVDQLYKSGEIEKDFYFRINDRVLEIPPLRKRREDIPSIVLRELELLNKIYSRKISIDEKANNILTKFNWPGNYHQLKRYLLDIYEYCDMNAIDIITGDIINNKPPKDIIVDSENPFNDLENCLFKSVLHWKPEDGKLISDLIEPMLANIYIHKLNGIKTQATKYIQIDGSGGVNSTLDKRLNQYKLVAEKFLNN